MTPHETGSITTPGDSRATAPLTRTFGPQGPTLGDLIDAYLQDYQVRQFRSQSTARGRTPRPRGRGSGRLVPDDREAARCDEGNRPLRASCTQSGLRDHPDLRRGE